MRGDLAFSPLPTAQVLCSCLHDARVQRANKTWHLLAKSDNARRVRFMLLLGIPQEVAKKGTKGTPLGTPLPDGFCRAAGAFSLASLLHLGRMSARPRWVCSGKSPCFPRLPLVLAKLEAQH